ncbi:MAG TPA: HIT family protein [Terriglobales bacterium]|nr:HIT family protein [Terriglobales bacterium]
MPHCVFCKIAAGEVPASVVFDDGQALAFLDHRPLFPGHCLLIPKIHVETLAEASPEMLAHLSGKARLLSMAVEEALGAQGSFVALNNRVSQSVPHLHIHVVPRTKGDGLKGFFWPRQKYSNIEHVENIRSQLENKFRELSQSANT